MKIIETLSDEIILIEMGMRIARHRLDLELTQQEVATQAGISKRTLERIESGAPTQTPNLIRVLRVLQLLSRLDHFIPETETRPLDALKQRKVKQRASKKHKHTKPQQPWSWGDDQ